MIKYFTTLIIGLLFSLTIITPINGQDWSKIFKQTVDRHVVKIELAPDKTTERKDRGNCTGVVVGNRKVLTAAHCFYPEKDTEKPYIGYINNKQVEILKFGPVDLALLNADTFNKTAITIPFISPVTGKPVAAIGFAAGDTHFTISPMFVIFDGSK